MTLQACWNSSVFTQEYTSDLARKKTKKKKRKNKKILSCSIRTVVKQKLQDHTPI